MIEGSHRRALFRDWGRKVATARALPAADVALIALCWPALGVASFLIAALPSRVVLRWLGRSAGAVDLAPAAGARERRHAERIGRAVAAAARNAPFRANCYPQALTAALLCRLFRVPHAVHLGARFAVAGSAREGGLEGHAWVRSGQVTICGGAESARAFATVACFIHLPRSGVADVAG